MTTSTFIKGLLAAFVLSLVGDMLWHNYLLADFYNARLQSINGGTVPAFSNFMIALELLAAAITTYFVLAAAKTRTIGEGAVHGAMLGFAMCGAINFLNHSLFPGWDLTLVEVDTAFGVVLGAIVGAGIILATGGKK
jgi:uncharacterized membrane protein